MADEYQKALALGTCPLCTPLPSWVALGEESKDQQKAHEPPTSARARAVATATPATLVTHTTGTGTSTRAGTGEAAAAQAQRRTRSAPPPGCWRAVLRVLIAASAHSVIGVL